MCSQQQTNITTRNSEGKEEVCGIEGEVVYTLVFIKHKLISQAPDGSTRLPKPLNSRPDWWGRIKRSPQMPQERFGGNRAEPFEAIHFEGIVVRF
ncbi:hypothetical protein Baya_6046 [Bagarius yarrelli]|uniref:Uncharacterized protein n=1 Tax=Bagarius yarrelli TaxID=175774 RepID=A0A556U0Y6_BAGYA|nr:hypothetical protein Baya_6046 [Bagarius yarrelli]